MLSRTKLVIALMIVTAAALLFLKHSSKSAQFPADSNPKQAPLQIDNSGNQLQAGGVDLQSSIPSGSGASPLSDHQTSSQPNSGTTTSQPPANQTQPRPSPCNACTPGAGRVCPDSATNSCFCQVTPTNSADIACLEQ